MHEDLLECTPRNISLDKDKLEVSKKDACASESSEPIEFEKLITLLNIDKAAAAPLVENEIKAYLPSKKSFKMTTLPCKRLTKKSAQKEKRKATTQTREKFVRPTLRVDFI